MTTKSVYEDIVALIHQVEQGQTSRAAAIVALVLHGHEGDTVDHLIRGVVVESELTTRDPILTAADSSVADVVSALTTAWTLGPATFADAVRARLSLEPPSNTAVSMVAGEILAETPTVDPATAPCAYPYRRAYQDGVRALADALKVPRD